MDETLPSAYTVQEVHGRWFPMRFGRFRLDSRGYRVSFGRREDAEAFCHNEQREYVTAYPSVVERLHTCPGCGGAGCADCHFYGRIPD